MGKQINGDDIRKTERLEYEKFCFPLRRREMSNTAAGGVKNTRTAPTDAETATRLKLRQQQTNMSAALNGKC